MNSAVPMVRSRPWMAWVSGGWVICNRVAAWPKCNASANETNWRHRLNSIIGGGLWASAR